MPSWIVLFYLLNSLIILMRVLFFNKKIFITVDKVGEIIEKCLVLILT